MFSTIVKPDRPLDMTFTGIVSVPLLFVDMYSGTSLKTLLYTPEYGVGWSTLSRPRAVAARRVVD